MKKGVSSLIALLLSITLVYSADAHVTLLSPVGGESFTSGREITVEWQLNITHNQQNWDLYFSSDGGVTWQALQLDLPIAQLTYQWVVPEGETSQGRIKIVQDNAGQNYEDVSGDFVIEAVATAIDHPDDLPAPPALLASYPNPFTTETVFELTIARAGPVTLEVFDVQGKKVAVLVDRELARGSYQIRWNAVGLAGGVYFYRIRVGAYVESKKVLLVK